MDSDKLGVLGLAFRKATRGDIFNEFVLMSVAKDCKIIDVGGGDSNLEDHLLEIDYADITVLDISSSAIERARERWGSASKKVKWIVYDILDFIPPEKYQLWHDRATSFLTSEIDIERYASLVDKNKDDFVIMGTFSGDGPKKMQWA